jgi:CHAT domain-containing protein
MKPERSAIQLSQQADSLDDGLLSAREIFSLRTKANLVVLSSCESGLGRLIRGEGIEGLNRAFFFAGTSAVLMSLWKVNDEASFFLMDRFYYYLKASESVVSALKKAKQDILNNSQYSHPYYWAPFVLSGDGNTRIFSYFNRAEEVSIFIGVSLFLFFIILLSKFLTTVKKLRNRSHLNNRKKI